MFLAIVAKNLPVQAQHLYRVLLREMSCLYMDRGCRDEGPTTVAALLDLNTGGQVAKLPVEAMLKVYYIDNFNGVRPRLEIAHLKGG